MLDHLLHIVVDPIQDRALINDEDSELFKDLGKLFNRFRDSRDLFVTLIDELRKQTSQVRVRMSMPLPPPCPQGFAFEPA